MKIWKYVVALKSGPFAINMPLGSVPLAIQMQRGEPCLWVRVNPEMPMVSRRFQWIATGQEYDQESTVDYIGTVQASDPFVFHLFEVH